MSFFCTQKEGEMAEKLYYIEELAERTLNDLNKKENWVNYLVSSS